MGESPHIFVVEVGSADGNGRTGGVSGSGVIGVRHGRVPVDILRNTPHERSTDPACGLRK